MELTVLGGCGAWPTAGAACSGYLVEHAGFRLLLDPGYATLPRLLEYTGPETVDAVLVSHGHPDHCADLNPLLRARSLGEPSAPLLPVYAPPGAVDAVLALDAPGMSADACLLREFRPGERLCVGPFGVETLLLPHHVPNAGIRLSAQGAVLAYTGDTGPSPAVAQLADGADLLLAEATHVREVPVQDAPFLLSAQLAGRYAQQAGVGRLLLTHLWPGTGPDEALEAAVEGYPGPLGVAVPGLRTEVGGGAPSS